MPLEEIERHDREKVEFIRSYHAPESNGDMVYHPSFGLRPIAEIEQPAEKPKAISKDKQRIATLEIQLQELGRLLDQVRHEIRESVDAEATLARVSELIGSDRPRQRAAALNPRPTANATATLAAEPFTLLDF